MKKTISAIFATILGVAMVTACSASPDADLNGYWEWQEEDILFETEVADGEIKTFLTMDDLRALYWVGSFPTFGVDGEKIESEGYSDELDGSIFGSMDETKEFTFKDGKLYFEFGIVGTSTNVELEKK